MASLSISGKLYRGGLDTLRMTDKQWQAMLDEIDAQTRSFEGRDRRRESRRRYKKSLKLIIRVEHPGGSAVTFRIRSRDISSCGIGFLHGSFIYPQTPCTIVLPTANGELMAIRGKAVRCRLLKGKLHEVGIEFHEPIDLEVFLGPLPKEEKDAGETDTIFRRKPSSRFRE